MAKKLGLERPTYKNWEMKTEPNLTTIKTIAQVLEIPAHTLLAGVIDFTEDAPQRPDVKIEAVLTSDQLEKVVFSLGILDSVFGYERETGKDIVPGSRVPLSGNKKPLPSEKKRVVQKGI